MMYRDWLAYAQQQLVDVGIIDSPRLDACLLLQNITRRDRAAVLAFDDTFLTADEISQLTALLNRRCEGEPIAYILGEKAFWTLNLMVSRDTLIPRPDTEILVEQALHLARAEIAQRNLAHFSILDLGTGTGAIILALASELQPYAKLYDCQLRLVGVDRVVGAVELAKQNLLKNGLSDVEFIQSDWFTALPHQTFDLIVSNPPYISANDEHLMQGDIRFEPRSALVAADDGLADFEHIICESAVHLCTGGFLLFEHGWQQANLVTNLFRQAGWDNIQSVEDHAGHLRVTLAQLNK